MHFKNHLNLIKTIGFKVSAWYSGIFVLSSLLLFLIAYYFLSATVKSQDHEEILLEQREISSLYELGGFNAVGRFVTEHSTSRRTKPLFIRIADNANKTRHIFSPEQWQDFDLAKLERIYPAHNNGWIPLTAMNGEYILEMHSARLSRGYWVQVGMSSEGRENVLGQFRKIVIVVMIPLFIFGLIGGIVLSRRTLKPIRNIIKSVRSIEIGKKTAEVPRSMTGDELDELAGLFNEMLDNIHRLVIGMKNSLDNVAHDLRTPMTRFRNISEMALQAGDDVELFREALEKGVEESNIILKMLDTLMDISEAETGIMSIDLYMVNVSVLIGKIADMYQFVAEEKEINLQISSPENLNIEADSNRISQALSNILDNAIKFTPAGGQINIEAQQINRELVIKIQDTGIGIGFEELTKIWDRLYRGDQSRTKKGLGLGLSLVKGIIKAHNGRIEVNSELGKGTTFTISLPKFHSNKD